MRYFINIKKTSKNLMHSTMITKFTYGIWSNYYEK